ncbi:hypothetical protein SBC2_63030 (plasmid) [Caballeronia sp. SBC2]|nr:hypothetical protein SBC2_63030 [Caballeronia sp. SBC2]
MQMRVERVEEQREQPIAGRMHGKQVTIEVAIGSIGSIGFLVLSPS